jgi:hypothetical protein
MRTNRKFSFIAFFAVLLWCILLTPDLLHSRTVYKWVDANGQLHFTDYPPQEGQGGILQESIEVKEAEGRKSGETAPGISSAIAEALNQIGETLPASLQGTEMEKWVQSVPIFSARDGTLEEQLTAFFSSPQMRLFQLWSGMMMTFIVALVLFGHFYYALCLYLICRKVEVGHGWLAWVPVVNFFPLVRAAGKSGWWSIPLLAPMLGSIPQVAQNPSVMLVLFGMLVFDLVFIVVLWVRICHNLWINKWFGLLVLIPPVHMILMGYLAFREEPEELGLRRLRPAVVALIFFLVLTAGFHSAFHKVLMPRLTDQLLQDSSALTSSEIGEPGAEVDVNELLKALGVQGQTLSEK